MYRESWIIGRNGHAIFTSANTRRPIPFESVDAIWTGVSPTVSFTIQLNCLIRQADARDRRGDVQPVANVCWCPFQYVPQVSVEIAKQRLQTKVAAYMELKTTRNAQVVASCGKDGFMHFDMVDETMNPVAVFRACMTRSPAGVFGNMDFTNDTKTIALMAQHPLIGVAVVLIICWTLSEIRQVAPYSSTTVITI